MKIINCFFQFLYLYFRYISNNIVRDNVDNEYSNGVDIYNFLVILVEIINSMFITILTLSLFAVIVLDYSVVEIEVFKIIILIDKIYVLYIEII